MSAIPWMITSPTGLGTVSFEAAGLEFASPNFRVGAVSTASFTVIREYDSEDAWWAADSIVTVFRGLQPFFTGRVQETPQDADGSRERRVLELADAGKDLEDITYQEVWGFGTNAVLVPKAILGLNESGIPISTGAQIGAIIDYAISQDAYLQKGTIDAGPVLWPSMVVNQPCDALIRGELRFTPDWVWWLDHTTVPPTFHARSKTGLTATAYDIAAENVGKMIFAKVERNVPRGVRILYEDAKVIDGEVFREGYLDTAGATTGRKILHATIELEGMNMQTQKMRVQTRAIPPAEADKATLKAYMEKKFPVLKSAHANAWAVVNYSLELVEEEEHPDPVCEKAQRITVADVTDLPNELLAGSIEDWMRRKVGKVSLKYDFLINPAAPKEERERLKAFAGEGKGFTVTATNAITKLYKGITSFTEGEKKPVGIATAVFAAATAEVYEGSVTLAAEEVSAPSWLGCTISLVDGGATVMPAAIVHSAAVDIAAGTVTVSFGPLPYLSAGDFLELQRMVNSRPVTWMSAQERSSNKIGSDESASAKGDTVGGYNHPETITPPGGGKGTPPPFWPTLFGNAEDGYKLDMQPGAVQLLKMGEADADELLPVESIPDGLAVAVGDKIWVTAVENPNGEVTGPTIGKGSAWPESTAPKLLGGEDSAGTDGTRIWRLCEVQAGESETASMLVHLTGTILHFGARLLENTVTGTSSGQGNVLKEYELASRQWKLRTLSGVDEDGPDTVDINEVGNFLVFRTKGGAKKVQIWEASVVTGFPSPGVNTNITGSEPVETWYFYNGQWDDTEPDGWSSLDPEPPTVNRTFVIPTSGGFIET